MCGGIFSRSRGSYTSQASVGLHPQDLVPFLVQNELWMWEVPPQPPGDGGQGGDSACPRVSAHSFHAGASLHLQPPRHFGS